MRKTRLIGTALVALLLPLTAFAAPRPMTVGEEIFEVIETGHPYVGAAGAVPQLVQRFEITHPGAAYVAPHFSRFELAPGDYVIVRSPANDRSWRYDGFGKGELGRSGGFWGVHIKGDTAVVELHVASAGGEYGFTIDRYARGFRGDEVPDPLVPESLCGTDDSDEAKCYLGMPEYDEARAVARLLIQGFSGCTGWLLGDEGHLVTNNHCIGSQTAASNTDYEFMAEGDSCATNCEAWWACPGNVEATSATLIQTDFSLDYTLVELPTNPTGTYGFMQMRESGPVMEEQIYIPQHAAGWGKRLALESTHADNPSGFGEVDSLSEPTCQGGGPPEVGYYLDTQGGSSGSPVLANSDLCVVALHHCRGNIACTQQGGDPNRGVASDDIIADMGGNLPNNALCGGGGGFPKCLQFSDFCDAIQIDGINDQIIDAAWCSWDCAGTDCTMKGEVGVSATSPCDGSNAAAGIRGLLSGGCPGDFWWALDSLDGTMDMVSGVPPGGTCWIDELAYIVIDGPCPGACSGGGGGGCYYEVVPGVSYDACVSLSGISGNADVRFDWVLESYQGPGMNCPILGSDTAVVPGQAPGALVCDRYGGPPVSCEKVPPEVGAHVLVVLITVTDSATGNLLFDCSPGKIDCNGSPTSCP